VDGSVAAERDHHLSAVVGGFVSEFTGVSPVGGGDGAQVDGAAQRSHQDVSDPGVGRGGVGIDDQDSAHLHQGIRSWAGMRGGLPADGRTPGRDGRPVRAAWCAGGATLVR